MNRYIVLDEQNKVVSVRYGKEIVEGEILSEAGELGQIMQPDGSFITPEQLPSITQPTLEEMVQQLQQDNLILMDALATTFEEILNLKAQMGGSS